MVYCRLVLSLLFVCLIQAPVGVRGVCLPNQVAVEAAVVCDLIRGCMPTTLPGTFDEFVTGSQPFPRSGLCSISIPGGVFTVTIPPLPGNTAEICYAVFRSCIDPVVEVIRVPVFIRIPSSVTQSSESSQSGSDSGLLDGGSSSSSSSSASK